MNTKKTVTLLTWHPKEDIPPEYGDYLVLGLRSWTPDHYKDPDARWEIMFAHYLSHGWSTKIKCWANIPELPEKHKKFLGKVTHFDRVRW